MNEHTQAALHYPAIWNDETAKWKAHMHRGEEDFGVVIRVQPCNNAAFEKHGLFD